MCKKNPDIFLRAIIIIRQFFFLFFQVKMFNNQTIVTSSIDQSISVWNIEDAKLIYSFRGKYLILDYKLRNNGGLL